MTFTIVLLKLLFGHALADYPLQGDFLARGKNAFAPLDGVPWYQCLFWHALIHSGFVLLITGSLWLALCELALHMLIDFLKCANVYSFNSDQLLHIMCKVIYAMFIAL